MSQAQETDGSKGRYPGRRRGPASRLQGPESTASFPFMSLLFPPLMRSVPGFSDKTNRSALNISIT